MIVQNMNTFVNPRRTQTRFKPLYL